MQASVAHASINKPGLADGQNPHLLALQFLTEKIERWLKSQSHELSQRALLVADQNHEHDQYAFDLIQEMQFGGGPVGGRRGLNISLNHIVDGVYFARSERSWGIQLADLVAFILNRSERTRPPPGQSAVRRRRENAQARTHHPPSRDLATLWPSR